MAALTTDRNTPMKDGELIPLLAAAAKKFFAGAIVCVDANGYATPGATATTLRFMGRAEGYVDNSAGANGAAVVLVRRKAAFQFANLAADLVVQADVGNTCYIVDDQTVAKTNGGATRSAGGKILAVDAAGVWVEA
ncbi:MAG: hypothetical protein HXX17_11945 [Geobacteraceae bacterium]|nr:hypothetical protein [Geobacteraceae bacterium]